MLLAMFTLLISCSDDDKTSSVSVVGKWQASTQENYECPNSSDNNKLTCGTYAFCYTIEFKSDKTFQMTRSTDNIGSGKYYLSGDKFSLDFTSNPFGYSSPALYSFTISGNTLTTIYAPGGISCKTKAVYLKM